MQTDLYAAAKQRLKSNTVLANSLDEVESILAAVTAEKGGGKFVMAHLKDDPACDARLKEFKATVRCIPLVDEFDGPGKCIVTGEPGGPPRSHCEIVLDRKVCAMRPISARSLVRKGCNTRGAQARLQPLIGLWSTL